MTESKDGIDQDLAAEFDRLPDDERAIYLTKRDIALLINSLAELHESYAAMQSAPILLGRAPGGLERFVESEEHAKRSFDLFADLANGLMTRLVREAQK